MPFLRSSNRPQAVDCFFCLSPSLLPLSTALPDRKGKGKLAPAGTRWNWKCERCGCWNIRDAKGEILSDLPAMHSSIMNEGSYSLRARPSSSHIPSSSSTSPFCHSCLANQTLIMNMLSNYLPDDNDPSFPSLYANLPSYLSNLHSRYPPVCRNCQPAVDETLRKSDQKAQVEVWGSALNRGVAGGKEKVMGRASWVDILIWRIRGSLFYAATGLSWILGVMSCVNADALHRLRSINVAGASLPIALLCFHLSSILWIVWDPYWLKRRRRSSDTGRVKGRGVWIRNMLAVLLLRLTTTATLFFGKNPDDIGQAGLWVPRVAFTVELGLFIHALSKIRVRHPVALQLVRPISFSSSRHETFGTSSAINLQQHPQPVNSPFGQSPISPYPIKGSSNPMFGQPSLHNRPTPAQDDVQPMDWEPSPGAALTNGGYTRRPPDWAEEYDDPMPLKRENWDSFGSGRQRIFAPQPEDETGLEGLLASWGIGSNGPPVMAMAGSGGGESKRQLPIVGTLVSFWQRKR